MFSKVFYKILSLIQYNSKWNAAFIIFLIVLYNYGYVTEYRILVFSLIILWICLYKIIYKKVKNTDFSYNENLLYIILWIDFIKMCIISALIFISIKINKLIFFYKHNKIIKNAILIFENLTINPLKIILYKFYYILNIWNETPILELFFKRIYGSLLGILIFSNIIGYVWYLLNYSWLNVYIILVLLNFVDGIVKSGLISHFTFYKYLEWVTYLNLNKDLFKIIELRSDVSILVLYIQKVLQKSNLGIKKNKIKSFAFLIYLYFYKSFKNVRIIKFKNYVKQYQFNQLKISTNNNFKTFFDNFFFNIATLLENYFELLGQIEYVKIKLKKDDQFKATFSDKELIQIKELEKFLLLVIKILLYYLWDFENFNKNEYDFSSLIIDIDFELFHLEYNWDFSTRTKYIKNTKKEIFSINDQFNSFFYDQFFLYANLLSIYNIPAVSIDFENYSHIENYVEVFFNNITILNEKFTIYYKMFDDIDWGRVNDDDLTIRDEILENLNKYKHNFIEEWKISKNYTVEESNLKRLKELNEYIITKLK